MKSLEINQHDQLQTPKIKSMEHKIEFMEKKIKPFIKEHQFQVDFNRFLGILFSFTSIGLSLAVTLAGIYGNARLAAGLGAASAGVQTVFGIFPLEKRVWFYRASVAEAQKIQSFLEYKPEYSLEEIVDDFEALRSRTLTQEPLNSIPDSFSPNTVTDKQPSNPSVTD